MNINPHTNKYKALLVIAQSDGAPTQRKVANEIGVGYATGALSELFQADFVTREGAGGPHDPYRYTLTSKGVKYVENNGYEIDAVDHLSSGLESDDAEAKDYHITQALQRLGE